MVAEANVETSDTKDMLTSVSQVVYCVQTVHHASVSDGEETSPKRQVHCLKRIGVTVSGMDDSVGVWRCEKRWKMWCSAENVRA